MNAAVHELPSTAALTVQDRAHQALAAATTENALRELAKKHTGLTTITGAAGRDDCHSAYMELKNTRVAIEKAGKDARDDATKFSKAVIAEETRLVTIISAEETRLKELRDVYDIEQERIRLAEAEREEKRIRGHMDAIAQIVAVPGSLRGESSSVIATRLKVLDDFKRDHWDEFADQAQVTVDGVRVQLTALLAGAIKAEEDAKELERLRAADRARQAKESEERVAREQQEREELEARRRALVEEEARQQVELKRKADEEAARLEALRVAEAERMRKASAEHDAKLAADARAMAEQLANERAEQEQEAAARRAEQAAEDQRLAQERADLERERRDAAAAERRREEALAAVDTKIAAAAPRYHAALMQLRGMLPPGTPEGDLVDATLTEAGF